MNKYMEEKMRIIKTATAEQIVELALGKSINDGIDYNGSSEKRSDYFDFLRDEAGNSVSLDITEEVSGLKPRDRFYSVHLVDEINKDKPCELFTTDYFTKESLLATVSEIIKSTLENIMEIYSAEICEKFEEETELSQEHLERNYEIYSAAYQFIQILLEKNEDDFPWNMEYIGNVTEAVVQTLNELGQRIRWPSVVMEKDGTQYIEEYYEPIDPPTLTNSSKKVEVESVFGTLTAVAASDSLYPGIYLYLKGKDGKEFEAALFEATSEYPSDDQTALRVLVWGNPERDDYTEEYLLHITEIPRVFVEPEWVKTDDASYQWVKKISGTKFELIEMALINPEEELYHVYADTLELCDYFDGKDRDSEMKSILDGFGYSGVEDIKERYKEMAMQVIAECIFEHYADFQADVVYRGSENLCCKYIETYIGNGISGFRRLIESDIIFEDEIMVNDIDGHRYLSFYMAAWFDVDAVFGTNINAKENDDNLNVYADYDIGAKNVMDRLDVMINHADGEVTKLAYHLDDDEKNILLIKMEAYCQTRERKTLEQFVDFINEESDTGLTGTPKNTAEMK